MPIGIEQGELIPVLLALVAAIQSGLTLSGVGYVSFRLTEWLSKYGYAEPPDPTIFKRRFAQSVENLFTPIGETAVHYTSTPVTRQTSFYLAVGAAVVVAALSFYLTSATVILGGVVATYQTTGIFIDPAPLFRQIVAFAVLWALAVMFYAEEQARQYA